MRIRQKAADPREARSAKLVVFSPVFWIRKYFFRIRIRNTEIMDLDSGGQVNTDPAGLIRILTGHFLSIENYYLCCQVRYVVSH